MSEGLFFAPVKPCALADIPSERKYDALLCSIGYESRSRAIATHVRAHAEVVTGVEFERGHNDVYRANRAAFDALEAEIVRMSDHAFETWVVEWFGRFEASGEVRLAVDVSSMSRPRIAAVVQALSRLGRRTRYEVDLLYVPAVFEAPPTAVPDATEALEPVLTSFAGEPADPQQPMILLFGLGYEPERAASAVDEFAPDRAQPFFPLGTDERFRAAVSAANADVLTFDEVADPITYSLRDPFKCFSELEALVEEMIRDRQRPLLLPLGPKIFAAVCMLVAVSTSRAVPVWRVSAGAFDGLADRQADSELVTLRVGNQPILPASTS